MRNKTRLKLRMMVYVFFISLASTILVMIGTLFMIRIGFFAFERGINPIFLLLCILFPVLFLVTIFSAIFSKRPFKPIEKLIIGIEEVGKGNFDVKLEESELPTICNVAKSFNRMTEELRSTETLRKDFIANFSHEFKTPIASVRGFAKLLKKKGLSEAEKNEYIDIIIDESERLSQLAANTLNISKLESQGELIERCEFRLDELMRQCLLILENRWAKKNLRLSVDLEEVDFLGSESLMHQVFINLLDNAIKFSQDSGDLAVSMAKKGNNAVIVVTDNGIGISEEDQKNIFDKFYQGDKSRRIEGNGLGLAIVKRIIYLHQGSINVKSNVGEGTSFTVVLPLFGI